MANSSRRLRQALLTVACCSLLVSRSRAAVPDEAEIVRNLQQGSSSYHPEEDDPELYVPPPALSEPPILDAKPLPVNFLPLETPYQMEASLRMPIASPLRVHSLLQDLLGKLRVAGQNGGHNGHTLGDPSRLASITSALVETYSIDETSKATSDHLVILEAKEVPLSAADAAKLREETINTERRRRLLESGSKQLLEILVRFRVEFQGEKQLRRLHHASLILASDAQQLWRNLIKDGFTEGEDIGPFVTVTDQVFSVLKPAKRTLTTEDIAQIIARAFPKSRLTLPSPPGTNQSSSNSSAGVSFQNATAVTDYITAFMRRTAGRAAKRINRDETAAAASATTQYGPMQILITDMGKCVHFDPHGGRLLGPDWVHPDEIIHREKHHFDRKRMREMVRDLRKAGLGRPGNLSATGKGTEASLNHGVSINRDSSVNQPNATESKVMIEKLEGRITASQAAAALRIDGVSTKLGKMMAAESQASGRAS